MSAGSASRHHADWLSLVEVSGPFISLPVLLRVFPQGLEPRDPAQAKALRAAYDEWQDNPTAPSTQRAWVLHVLTAVLGYPLDQLAEGQALPAGLEANMPEMGETLRPDFALVGPAGSEAAGQAQLLVANYPAEQALDRPVIGKHWKATPATRMMELLHGAGVPLGVVTNGEHWMLVYAPPRDTTGYASWYGALWLDEPITLRAFHSLLGVRRFFGVAADSTLLALLRVSASDQQEVTDQLGYQVREAVEVLVQSFDALDKERNRTLLTGVSPSVLYDAALTVMMRLVFLFSAEERGLLHLGKPLYDDNYAVSTLQEQLQEVADRYGEEVLERRYDAWARLLATFRAVHGGIRHQDLLMQAYGGSLFNPDRYPFLEGRREASDWRSASAEPLAVNNRVVLHLLNSLQRLRTKIGADGTAETRRISFRALGVEQIGHVYEGLLDHTAVRATDPVLGIKGTRSKEPEIPLATLESMLAQGQDKLINFINEETGRSIAALRRTLEDESPFDEHRLLIACGHDKALLDRLCPFAGLIREDSFERPLVVLRDSVYVTAGSFRRSTGTHYTPPSLTEPIVQHTLEPLVYEGPAEGWPQEQWRLKLPKAILDLKVCDMAMGSGAFLVQACRFLAERLVEAWENEERQHPGQVLITPDGKFSMAAPSERLVPSDPNERIAVARRVVADRCLYGVDINPMAVEMAKLSLWLITVDAKRPFTFLDHAFKCGDSLLGITSMEQLERFSLRASGGKQQAFATLELWRHIEEARKKREVLEALPSDTPEQIAAKEALYAEAEVAVAKLNAAADVLVAVELKGLKGNQHDAALQEAAERMVVFWSNGLESLQGFAQTQLTSHHPLHWPLSFPEAFSRGGFDALVGNPPFVAGSDITGILGSSYRDILIRTLAEGKRGNADLVAYFFLRSGTLGCVNSYAGFVATKTIAQGETRAVGLEQLLKRGATIYRCNPVRPWPGSASLAVAHVWLSKGTWAGEQIIDNVAVSSINSYLTEAPAGLSGPFTLQANTGQSFTGTKIYGEGFLITPEQARALIASNSLYKEVLFPYLNGDDLNSDPQHTPSRWTINFGNRTLEEASSYPACFEIVRKLVKPYRATVKSERTRERWWIFERPRGELYALIGNTERVLVCSEVTKHLAFCFVPTGIIFAANLDVFPFADFGLFAILQSSIHDAWARSYCAHLETRLKYSPGNAYETFPFPSQNLELQKIGKQYCGLRERICITTQAGITRTYNRFHDPEEVAAELGQLRALRVQMDCAVAIAYGWQSLDLGHGFHETKQGVRYTINESARREVLDRLLDLNHKRYAEEDSKKVAQGLAAPAKRKRTKSGTGDQVAMDV